MNSKNFYLKCSKKIIYLLLLIFINFSIINIFNAWHKIESNHIESFYENSKIFSKIQSSLLYQKHR